MASQLNIRPRRQLCTATAIEALYAQRLDEFCSVVAAITRDRDGARDIVHEAFASALRSQERFRAEGSLSAWVWRIVINAAKDHQRRNTVRLVEWHDGYAGVEVDQASPRVAVIRAAIQRLPERQRIAIFLRYYADLDYQQIAQVLSISIGTVAAMLNSAHRTLQGQVCEVPE